MSPICELASARLRAGLGEPIRLLGVLGRPRAGRVVRAAETEGRGALVVKLRHGDRAGEKTEWCALNLPLLAARGYPVPSIAWHGAIDDNWYAVVEQRLPGAPLTSLSSEQLSGLLGLVELQANAGIAPGPRDFGGYVSNVLFNGWDDVWSDAESASPAAVALCAHLRELLRPQWGRRLSAADFAHNDLNLTNVLGKGSVITGVVDWDEFGLNSRAADLSALAFDCIRLEKQALVPSDAAKTVLDRARAIAGEDEMHCLLAYRAIAQLAALVRRGERNGLDESLAVANRVLEVAGCEQRSSV